MIEIRQTHEYETWFEKLKDENAQARITIRVLRLSHGNPGDVKPVGHGVSELRIDYGPGYRIYYVQRGNVYIVLLAGGNKKTQNRDIARALELAKGV